MFTKKKTVKPDTTKEDIKTLQDIVIGLSDRIKSLENTVNKAKGRLGI
jgi:hypothetical protein